MVLLCAVVTKGNLILNLSQNKALSSKHAPTTRRTTSQKPNEIRHNYATCVDHPLIKKSLPSHPQGVGATLSEGDGRWDPPHIPVQTVHSLKQPIDGHRRSASGSRASSGSVCVIRINDTRLTVRDERSQSIVHRYRSHHIRSVVMWRCSTHCELDRRPITVNPTPTSTPPVVCASGIATNA